MQKKWQFAAMGALAGTVATMVLAMPSIIPYAWADEQPILAMVQAKHQVLELFDRDLDLFKPQWSAEPGFSQVVAATHVVRKIEAGKTSFVSVVTTPTGIYSSDGLDSPNFRYPGLHRDTSREYDAVAYLSDGSWVGLKLRDANSFAGVVPFKGGLMVLGSD